MYFEYDPNLAAQRKSEEFWNNYVNIFVRQYVIKKTLFSFNDDILVPETFNTRFTLLLELTQQNQTKQARPNLFN